VPGARAPTVVTVLVDRVCGLWSVGICRAVAAQQALLGAGARSKVPEDFKEPFYGPLV